MDDNEARAFKYVVMGIVALAALLIGSCQTTNYQIRKMVEAGAHPTIAECAVTSEGTCGSLLIIELEKQRAQQVTAPIR